MNKVATRRLFLASAISLFVGFSSCSRPKTPNPTENPKAEVKDLADVIGARTVDACSLLTSEEIESVLGEPVKETKPETKTGKASVSQCYFTLPTFSNSISLQVIRKGTETGSREVKQAWKEMFPDVQPPAAGGEARRREPAQKIEGLGDEAFWSGNQTIGALYVLRGDFYLRISVGGGDDMTTKINKSSELARKVLNRL